MMCRRLLLIFQTLTVVVVILCFAMVACNTAPVLVQQSSLHTVSLRAITSKGAVLLLPPQVAYERVESGDTFDGNAAYFEQSPREAFLSSMAGKTLSENVSHFIDSKQLNTDPTDSNGGLLERLKQNYHILASSFKDKTELLPYLQKLHNISGADMACMITLKVKAGKGAGYSPLNGGMWQGTSSSNFKVVFLSLSTGEHLWRNEVYVRNLPTDEVISESMGLLFQGIEENKKEAIIK